MPELYADHEDHDLLARGTPKEGKKRHKHRSKQGRRRAADVPLRGDVDLRGVAAHEARLGLQPAAL
jgi:DNA-nicking Smr family endonuclease